MKPSNQMKSIAWVVIITLGLPPQICFADNNLFLQHHQPYVQQFTDRIGYTSPQNRLDETLLKLSTIIHKSTFQPPVAQPALKELTSLRNFIYGQTSNDNLSAFAKKIAYGKQLNHEHLYILLAMIGTFGAVALPIKSIFTTKYLNHALKFLTIPTIDQLDERLKNGLIQTLIASLIVIAGGFAINKFIEYRANNLAREQFEYTGELSVKLTALAAEVADLIKTNDLDNKKALNLVTNLQQINQKQLINSLVTQNKIEETFDAILPEIIIHTQSLIKILNNCSKNPDLNSEQLKQYKKTIQLSSTALNEIINQLRVIGAPLGRTRFLRRKRSFKKPSGPLKRSGSFSHTPRRTFLSPPPGTGSLPSTTPSPLKGVELKNGDDPQTMTSLSSLFD